MQKHSLVVRSEACFLCVNVTRASHCVKSIQIRRFFLVRISPHSDWIWRFTLPVFGLFTQWWSSSKNCSCKYSNVHIQVFITQHLPKSITGLTWQVWYVIKPFSVNFTKSSNTQTIHRLPTNCLSVFHHFVGLTLKGLND